MKFLKYLDAHLEEILLVLLSSFICCVVMLQVIMRFVFRSPLPWPEEIAKYALVLTCAVSIPYTIRQKSIIRIDFVTQFLPLIVRQILDVVIYIAMIPLVCYVMKGGWAVFLDALSHGSVTAAVRLPLDVVYGIVLIFLGVTLVRIVQTLVLTIREMVQGKTE